MSKNLSQPLTSSSVVSGVGEKSGYKVRDKTKQDNFVSKLSNKNSGIKCVWTWSYFKKAERSSTVRDYNRGLKASDTDLKQACRKLGEREGKERERYKVGGQLSQFNWFWLACVYILLVLITLPSAPNGGPGCLMSCLTYYHTHNHRFFPTQLRTLTVMKLGHSFENHSFTLVLFSFALLPLGENHYVK